MAMQTINDKTTLAGRDAAWLVDQVDLLRQAVNGTIEPETRTRYAQFMTSTPVSAFMASMFRTRRSSIHLLDAGAAVGSLTAAFVAAMLKRPDPPGEICVTAFEIDGFLARHPTTPSTRMAPCGCGTLRSRPSRSINLPPSSARG